MIPKSRKKKKKSAVKSSIREDVDINKLVKSGQTSLAQPQPNYVDITGLPLSRGEAAQHLQGLYQNILTVNPTIKNPLTQSDFQNLTVKQIQQLLGETSSQAAKPAATEPTPKPAAAPAPAKPVPVPDPARSQTPAPKA